MQKILAVGFSILAFSACGKKSGSVPFTGTWTHVVASEVSGHKSTETVAVVTDGTKMRLTRTSQDPYGGTNETTQIYDGQNLFTRYAATPASGETTPEPPSESSEAPSAAALSELRFWQADTRGMESAPGGVLVGRETVLYQNNGERPDARFTDEIWVDKETGIMLRSSKSLYSKQAESMLDAQSWECTAITIGTADAQAFNHP